MSKQTSVNVFRQILLSTFFFATSFNARAGEKSIHQEDWQVTFGAGLNTKPTYEGAKEFDYDPFPLVIISWRGIITLGPDSLSITTLEFGPVSLAFSLGYNEGRDENDSNRLNGLGDIDATAQAGLDVAVAMGTLGSVATTFNIETRQDLGANDGLTVETGLSFAWLASPGIELELAASAIWADDRHMEDYFSISAHQSAASGLEPFDTDAGFKRLNLTIGGQWQVTDHWMMIGETSIGRLVGDAEDSTVTEDRLQPAIFLGFGYTF